MLLDNLQMSNFLDRKMTRQQFLLTLGMLVLTVSGVSGALKRISKLSPPKPKAVSGFGNGPYGV